MRHIDHGRVERLVELCDLKPHLHAQRRVEIGQGLVEQEGLGLAHDGAPDGDALALAAGQLPGLAVEIGAEIEDLRRLRHLLVDDLLFLARHFETEGDVVAHTHMRIERVGLEHHREPALAGRRLRHIDAVDHDRARGHILEPGDEAEQGGLAAARRADQHDELAVGDVEIERRDDGHRAERLAHAPQCHLTHIVSPFPT
jgi:hypothetical protein